MNAKEYLSQALNIDRSINSKLEQVASLHELATKATTLMSDMPGSANVKHFFTLLGKMFFTSYGKEFFTYLGKQIFTS